MRELSRAPKGHPFELLVLPGAEGKPGVHCSTRAFPPERSGGGNGQAQPRPEAGATQERTLGAVGCSGWIMIEASPAAYPSGLLAVGKSRFTKEGGDLLCGRCCQALFVAFLTAAILFRSPPEVIPCACDVCWWLREAWGSPAPTT